MLGFFFEDVVGESLYVRKGQRPKKAKTTQENDPSMVKSSTFSLSEQSYLQITLPFLPAEHDRTMTEMTNVDKMHIL